ncbi:MAG: hypothetical protein HFE62_04545 [Firmicutes bacterium]|nr:hypothetical protein [Bacillota bacterium]
MPDIESIFAETEDSDELKAKIKEFVENEFVPKSVFDEVEAKHMADMKENAVDKAILAARGRNPKAIKALIDMEKVVLNDDGSVEGIDIESIKKSDGYLFDTEETVVESPGFEKGSEMKEKSIGNRIAEAMGIKI